MPLSGSGGLRRGILFAPGGRMGAGGRVDGVGRAVEGLGVESEGWGSWLATFFRGAAESGRLRGCAGDGLGRGVERTKPVGSVNSAEGSPAGLDGVVCGR